MRRRSTPPGGLRRDHFPRQMQEHDPYAPRRQKKDAMVCDRCGVVWHGGLWTWGAPPVGLVEGGLCPACRRIEDRYPAGTIRIHGPAAEERDEILRLVANAVEHERKEHPLERVMDTVVDGDDLVVTTTGLHAARCIAGALKRRFHGRVAIDYGEEGWLVKVDVHP